MRSASFWIAIAVFQAAFGLAVFALTRQYYLSHAAVQAAPARAVAAASPWPETTEMLAAASAPAAPAPSTDPQAIARQADELFESKQYAAAAQRYEQLLEIDPTNVDLYNNLGITLHYLGRSAEALERLGRGAALNPQHQRIWLTTGFVNLELGNDEQARAALTNAARLGDDASIRASAQQMLATLAQRAAEP